MPPGAKSSVQISIHAPATFGLEQQGSRLFLPGIGPGASRSTSANATSHGHTSPSSAGQEPEPKPHPLWKHSPRGYAPRSRFKEPITQGENF